MRCTWDALQRVQENNKQRNAAQRATDSQPKPEKLQKLAKKMQLAAFVARVPQLESRMAS